MSFEHRPSPARVTEAAAAKLPRWMLFALLVAYIAPGLFGRDPWSLEDASAFGVMWTMANGSVADWWLPAVAGERLPEEGPLPFWVGAVFVRLLGGLFGDVTAARLASVFWFAVATSSVWYATYQLARRTEAQPVALAFGGEANPRDYGRMLADISVLLMLATFGIIGRTHEAVAETALFALVGVLVLALALSLEDLWQGTIGAGLVLGAIALTRGWLPAGALMVASLCFVVAYSRQRLLRAAVVVGLAFFTFSLWPLGARSMVPQESAAFMYQWWNWNAYQLRGPNLEGGLWLLRNSGWYLWPVWPFALWTLYSWRSFLRRPHVLLPTLIAAGALAALLLTRTASDRDLIAAVPPLVVLGSFGVSTLRRAADDTIDWFSMALFSLALTAVWLYFIAWNAGLPPKMAASVARLVPGLEPSVPLGPTLVALLATAAWFVLAGWRIRKRPAMHWRGPFLAAGGLTAVWVVGTSVFSDSIEYKRTYAPTAAVLAEQVRRVADDGCVLAHQLPPGTRAMLAYHGHLTFGRPETSDACAVAIHRDSQRTQLDDVGPLGHWRLVYETTRRARYDEVFRVWVRSR
jgi:4-amino-4-deoxy-L-arabinose transferase-like glycosyltransferase